ncbi:MAG: phage antirepressor KilAC domain-containing protein [Oscillospiraceae bacterium]|jgi:prophage antirepressor-like protein|nr:phage antirepressor KilAC domain-containing protein [Oscillospiraceae bacterium]
MELQVFNNSEFGELNVIEIDNKPYFPATECAKILGYKNPAEAIGDHCKGVAKCYVTRNVTNRHGTVEGEREINVIPESDLYRLIIRSKLPSAERFERWVCDEVLPSIRKHGMYLTELTTDLMFTDPRKFAEMAMRFADERDKRIAAEAENAKLLPAAQKYEAQTDTAGLYKPGEIAKDLGISAKTLNRFLHDCKLQFLPNGSKTWQLYTEYANDGFAVTKIVHLNNGKDVPFLHWTAKGRDFIFDLCEREQPDWYVG